MRYQLLSNAAVLLLGAGLGLSVFAKGAAHAHAAIAFVPDCSAGSNSAPCGLTSFLHVLYVVAAVLAGILIAVVALAVHAWRKNKQSEMTKQ